ncbi:MAG TPA: sulfite exporter TauE/SafE family protein, partial [Spirochaetota bacterium]|nr:sulfite exporter TauE/SafE family protein [Spirochaetota bacterium]
MPSIITIVVISLFIVLQHSGFLEQLTINNEKFNYSFAFFTGLIASVSSCFAVVGSIVIAFGEIYKSNNNKDEKGIFYLIKSNLLFHIGRLTTFFLLGGILGAIGGTLSLSGHFIGVLNIIIAVVMLLLGLNILGFVPSITQLGLKMPDFLTKNIVNLKKSRLEIIPLILGFLTFFLPCGFTQSMQIFAIGSGSFM